MKIVGIITLILFFIVIVFLITNSLIIKYVPRNSKFGKWWDRNVTSFTDMEPTDN